MNIKNLAIVTLVIGVAYFLFGFIYYVLILEDFFAEHTVKATMKSETEMKDYPMVFGNPAHAALLSYALLISANIKTFGAGLMCGAIMGN